eukprot:gene12814-17178_t
MQYPYNDIYLYENRTTLFFVGLIQLDRKKTSYPSSSFCTNSSFYRVLEIARPSTSHLVLADRLSIHQHKLRYSKKELADFLTKVKALVTYDHIAGIVGCIRLTESFYITIITKASIVASINGQFIYTIQDTALIPVVYKLRNTMEETTYRKLVEKMNFNRGYYFSYSYDVTQSLQNNIIQSYNIHDNNSYSINMNYSSLKGHDDNRFIWNHFLLTFLHELDNISQYGDNINCWIIHLIQGFVYQKTIQLYDFKKIKYSIISRRSRRFAGTRYLRRGVNEDGDVANEVETEQIITLENGSICRSTSLVQLRGSIPLYWAHQNLYSPTPSIHMDEMDESMSPLRLHMSNLTNRYGNSLYFLDLIKQLDSNREVPLGIAYRSCLEKLKFSISVYGIPLIKNYSKIINDSNNIFTYKNAENNSFIIPNEFNHDSTDEDENDNVNIDIHPRRNYDINDSDDEVNSQIINNNIIIKDSIPINNITQQRNSNELNSDNLSSSNPATQNHYYAFDLLNYSETLPNGHESMFNIIANICDEIYPTVGFFVQAPIQNETKYYQFPLKGNNYDDSLGSLNELDESIIILPNKKRSTDIKSNGKRYNSNDNNNNNNKSNNDNRDIIAPDYNHDTADSFNHNTDDDLSSVDYSNNPIIINYFSSDSVGDNENNDINNDDIDEKSQYGMGEGCRIGLLQNGILRTNCIDCLDRTNVAQFTYAKINIDKQLKALGLILSNESLSDLYLLCMEGWALNGDEIAIQYAGSEAMHRIEEKIVSNNNNSSYQNNNNNNSNQNNNGNQGIRQERVFTVAGNAMNALVAMKRYYSNIAIDFERQQSIDLMLGLFEPRKGLKQIWELNLSIQLARKSMKEKELIESSNTARVIYSPLGQLSCDSMSYHAKNIHYQIKLSYYRSPYHHEMDDMDENNLITSLDIINDYVFNRIVFDKVKYSPFPVIIPAKKSSSIIIVPNLVVNEVLNNTSNSYNSFSNKNYNTNNPNLSLKEKYFMDYINETTTIISNKIADAAIEIYEDALTTCLPDQRLECATILLQKYYDNDKNTHNHDEDHKINHTPKLKIIEEEETVVQFQNETNNITFFPRFKSKKHRLNNNQNKDINKINDIKLFSKNEKKSELSSIHSTNDKYYRTLSISHDDDDHKNEDKQNISNESSLNLEGVGIISSTLTNDVDVHDDNHSKNNTKPIVNNNELFDFTFKWIFG